MASAYVKNIQFLFAAISFSFTKFFSHNMDRLETILFDSSLYLILVFFLLLRQKTVSAKAKTSSELYHKNFLFFTRWHEMTIFREWKAKKSRHPALFTISFNFCRFAHIQTRKLCIRSRKPLYYHKNSQPVSVIVQTVSVFVYGFCLRVLTFA